MTQEELIAMVIRHDQHLRDINGDIREIKEELRFARRQQVASYRAAVSTLIGVSLSLALAVVQMLR